MLHRARRLSALLFAATALAAGCAVGLLGCADPGDDSDTRRYGERFPILYNLSLLRPEHAPIFVEAADAWNEAVGLELFIEDAQGFQPMYAEIDGMCVGLFDGDTILFDSQFTFATDCNAVLPQPFTSKPYQFLTIAVHEQGHALGLDHVSDESDVMSSPSPRGCVLPSELDIEKVLAVID